MTMRLTALGNTRASNRPYHILTKPMRRMRHIILRSRGLPRTPSADPERRKPVPSANRKIVKNNEVGASRCWPHKATSLGGGYQRRHRWL